MYKQDITQYSENELSLLVFNDEGLYRLRRQRLFAEMLRELFIFTDEQLAVLQQDLADEEGEEL